jgi:inositol 1,4,5-triphosphate receptor type 3
MIDSPNDEGDDLSLKKIYFIIDPRAYLISKNNLDNFFDGVDRTSSTTKTKALINVLHFFQSEVEYKEKFLKENSKSSKWLLGIEFKNVDFINFCLSLVINVIFMFFLKGGANEKNEILDYLIIILGLVTVFINLIYLIFFVLAKYKFYVNIEKSKLKNPLEMSLLDRIRIYIFTSFLANEEIYLMILNIFISLIGIVSKKFTFLFTLQLLTVVKFVPTIKEIVLAFKMRISQLASMIAFLGILIFSYSIIGFYFFINEFEMELENGKRSNLCKNMLECWITYFNLGVRSGGGIGDLLGPKSFSQDKSLYWIRYVTDLIFFVTVVLLLLNMINGVIVSTFSQIREESNNKEEDINNKCFICNIDRMEFEKRKIDFKWHLKYEHNSKTYIKFFICLGLIHEKDLDADQGFILECIKMRDVYCFPVGKSSSVGEIKEEGENDEKLSEDKEDQYDDNQEETEEEEEKEKEETEK